MSTPVIKVEGVSRQYQLRHLQNGGRQHHYTALRDVLANSFGLLVRRLTSPAKHSDASASETFWALRDVSFNVQAGESVGIIGRNGAGKSTLLKILSRITEPTKGRITIRGRVSSLLEVGTGFHPELTGRENIYLNGAILGMKRSEIRARFEEIVAFSEVERFLDTPVKRYSSGMYVRLAFAVAAHLEPDIFVVDEVLAVGDAEFQRRCMGKMRDVANQQGRTVLFVSHNMGAVTNLCTRGILLSKGQVEFNGSAEEAVQRYLSASIAQVQSTSETPPHVLYQRPSSGSSQPFAITRVETLDLQGRAKPIVMSGDACIFRITFEAERRVARGSCAIRFSGYDGSKVLLLSTDPDDGYSMSIEKGCSTLDCAVDRVPFSGGDWTLGVGLWVARTDECLCWTPELCILQIEAGDVYGAGMQIMVNRTLTTTPHHWKRP